MEGKYSCSCPECGKPKYFTEPVRARNRKARCIECRGKHYGNRDHCKLFLRTCATCGKGSATQREKISVDCIECSRKKVAKTMVLKRTPESYGGRTTYTYFCPTCPSVRVLKARRKTPYCKDCARIYSKQVKTAPKIYFDFEEMEMIVDKIRHVRICPHCPEGENTKVVQSKRLSGIKPCQKHKYVDNPEALAEKEAKRKATREANKHNHKKVGRKKGGKNKSSVSQEAIDKQIKINREYKKKIKYQIVDEETMEAPVKVRKTEVVPQLDEAESRRMQEEFLRKRNERQN